jgi:hypothetical protein
MLMSGSSIGRSRRKKGSLDIVRRIEGHLPCRRDFLLPPRLRGGPGWGSCFLTRRACVRKKAFLTHCPGRRPSRLAQRARAPQDDGAGWPGAVAARREGARQWGRFGLERTITMAIRIAPL